MYLLDTHALVWAVTAPFPAKTSTSSSAVTVLLAALAGQRPQGLVPRQQRLGVWLSLLFRWFHM
jgi:hypothetical protein